jgi:hypothetical protein
MISSSSSSYIFSEQHPPSFFMDDTSRCFVCLADDKRGLIKAPCACRGTIGFLHKKCLARLIAANGPTCRTCQRNLDVTHFPVKKAASGGDRDRNHQRGPQPLQHLLPSHWTEWLILVCAFVAFAILMYGTVCMEWRTVRYVISETSHVDMLMNVNTC